MRMAIPKIILALLVVVPVCASAASFQIGSPQYKAGAMLTLANAFDNEGCTGGNISPALTWKSPPKGTQSFLLTVYDPDAPSGWWHWVMYDIPGNVSALPAGITAAKGLPQGAVQGRSDFGAMGYAGPCPPPGMPHRYVFTLTALAVPKLDLPAGTPISAVQAAAHAHALGVAQLTLRYGGK
jgi:Raf kinase inhibitor-like YbhB/YbcL family protein